MRTPFVIAVSLALALPSPGFSQDYGLGGIDAYISASQSNMMTMNTIVGNAVFRASLKKKLARRNAAKVATTAKKAPAATQTVAPISAISFKPSSAVSEKSKETFFATLRSADPQSARQMEARFSKVNLHQTLSQAMAEHGLRADNVADAMTVWMVNLWKGANGQLEDPSPIQIRAIRAQMVDALRASPALATAKDAQKQELAEGLVLNAALVGAMASDPGAQSGPMRTAMQKAMTRVGANMGMDLRAMRITNEGFVS